MGATDPDRGELFEDHRQIVDVEVLPDCAARLGPRQQPAREAVGLLGQWLDLRRRREPACQLALRACRLTITEAVAIDPGGGRGRLERTGWQADDIDDIIRRVADIPDTAERWMEAERRTDDAFADVLGALDAAHTQRLVTTLNEARAAASRAA